MKERPILFSAPMVRAILEGRKTQTRRAIPENLLDKYYDYDDWCCAVGGSGGSDSRQYEKEYFLERCKYGQPGDRLWVRETWARYNIDQDSHDMAYKATVPSDWPKEGRWRPSIHMPRWASRIDLEITGVRVERLNEISEADCIKEGIAPVSLHDLDCDSIAPSTHFKALWESINGEGSWSRNPFVWVLEFKRVQP
jgi:hypothetical protein